jgi:threonine dehydratase
MKNNQVSLEQVLDAYEKIKNAVRVTPLTAFECGNGCELFLKREDLQETGAYKLRGAHNLVSRLSRKEKARGVVCASTGNHALGVVHACSLARTGCVVFMPENTSPEKIAKAKAYSGRLAGVELLGKDFDESSKIARDYAKEKGMVFVHPFDDARVISGQGTIAVELMKQLDEKGKTPDYVFAPVGGGGLITGIGAYIKAVSPKTNIVSVEPDGSTCLFEAVKHNERVVIDSADTFVDAVAVKQAGKIAFENSRRIINMYAVVPVNTVRYACSVLEKSGIYAEPAGALAFSALYTPSFLDSFEGKTVVCIVSGGNVKK